MAESTELLSGEILGLLILVLMFILPKMKAEGSFAIVFVFVIYIV